MLSRIDDAFRAAGLQLSTALDWADIVSTALEKCAAIVGNVGADAVKSTAFVATFKSAATNMTMATNVGEYTIVGKRCFFSLYATLTAKAGAGGDAISVVLPAAMPAVKNSAGLKALIDWKSNALTLGAANVPKAYMDAASKTINLQLNTASGAPTTNANLTNAVIIDGGTDFFIAGSYPID